MSQSDALVAVILDWARARAIGFSQVVSLGSQADVDLGDMLDHLGSDSRTRAIVVYIEAIESPRKFMSAARAAARNKPVIVVKSGRSPQGQQAAASHTGARAGSDMVYDPGQLEHLDRALAQFEAYCTVTQSISQSIPVTLQVFDSTGMQLRQDPPIPQEKP